ncbi:MAG: M56 family metallopeptidase [Chitinophagaceae bacterium]|nr:M56 family metallopeptidase [Chitinophagaceae bacterium]
MITGQTSFLQALGWSVINSLWQMALLWVIYQLITAIFKSSKPSHKSSLAVILLLTGFSWFIYTFLSVYSDHTANIAIASELIAANDPGVKDWMQQALPVASILYLLLLLVPISRFIRNYRYVQVIRKYGLTKIDVQWRVFVQKVAAQMGIKKPVHIWVSEFITSPVTIGFLKPVILMPLAAINHLSVRQMESVLLHELAHIRRHDYLVNLLINFIRTILYFNPFVKAFVRIVEKEREKSCDETVLQFQYNSFDYATALLTLEKTNHASQSFILSATGHKNDLLNRIETIVGVQKKKRSAANKLVGVIATLLCVITLNAIIFSGKNKSAGKTIAANEFLSSFVLPASEETASSASSPVLPGTQNNKTGDISPGEKFFTIIDAVKTIPGFINVNYAEPVEIPLLDKQEEEQVKAAVTASRKVLENAEWKSMEKNIADVLTQKEKEQLKKAYRKELNKFDWSSWENKLRIAYDNVDWSRVNDQLSRAVTNIRLDSLQKVYNEAICKLEETSHQLSLCDLKGIPDTDITLKAIEEKKLEVQKALNRIKSTRTRKIVHL